MTSIRTILRNLVLIATGIILLAVPSAVLLTLRIFGAAMILWAAFLFFVFRNNIRNAWRSFFTFKAFVLPNLILIVCGAILLIRPGTSAAIASILTAAYFLLGAVGRCRLMIFWRNKMSMPAFILRFAAIIATIVFSVLAIIMRNFTYLGLLLVVAGTEWLVGVITSPAYTAKLRRLVPHITLPRISLPKPKKRASKPAKAARAPKPAKPVEPEYSVPVEYIYTDSFMDKSVD